MASILYPWKTTSIIKDAASVIQPPKKGGKGQGSGGGSVGKGGQGKGLGKGRGGGAGAGGKPPSGGGGITGIHYHLDASDATQLYTDTGLTTNVSADGDLVRGWNASSTYTPLTATNPPTYKTNIVNGQSVVRFSNAALTYIGNYDDIALGTNDIPGDEFVYYLLVANISTGTDGAYAFIMADTRATGLQFYRYLGKTYPEFSNNNSVLLRLLTSKGDFPSTTLPNAISGQWGGATHFLTENFGDTVSADGGTTTCTFLEIGKNSTSRDPGFDLCELLIVDHVLDDAELATLKANWDDKWGTSFSA